MLKFNSSVLLFSLGLTAVAQAQPACLVNTGTTLHRNKDGSALFESFAPMPGTIITMTTVPANVVVKDCTAGDVIAIENGTASRVWRIDGARAGTVSLAPIGNLEEGIGVSSITFAHGKLYAIGGGAEFFELDPITFALVGNIVDLRPSVSTGVGGIAYDGTTNWYVTNGDAGNLVHLDDPPTAQSWHAVGNGNGNLGVGPFGSHGIEILGTELWIGMRSPDTSSGNLLVGFLSTVTGTFTQVWNLGAEATSSSKGFVAFAPECLDVTAQPAPKAVCPSASASFTVAAAKWSGSNLVYRWQIESLPAGSNNWNDLFDGPINGSAATASNTGTATLTISNARFLAARRYRCHVTNDCGNTYSIAAELKVKPDITGGPFINVDDLLAVINSWGRCPIPPAACAADVAPLGGNGTVNVDDLLAVINSWGQCP